MNEIFITLEAYVRYDRAKLPLLTLKIGQKMSKYGNKSCIDRFVMLFFRLIMYLCTIKNNE